jgi:squalene-hopene/tetraprenyl-beta-curcumene cyclase
MKSIRTSSIIAGALGVGALAFITTSVVTANTCDIGEPAIAAPAATPAQVAPKEKAETERFELGTCAPVKTASSKTAKVKANPKARASAQNGLDFLAKVGPQWQETNNCYGCHVQAVTVEAFSVAHSNQYRVNKASFDTMLKGMLDLDGGARHHADGLSHGSPAIARGAKILGAIAFGRYDEHVNTSLRKELLFEAEKIQIGRASCRERVWLKV